MSDVNSLTLYLLVEAQSYHTSGYSGEGYLRTHCQEFCQQLLAAGVQVWFVETQYRSKTKCGTGPGGRMRG